jgi:hypothetical protein
MKFGMHSPSWLDAPDSAEAFEAVRAKARWAEDNGFVWFSVMDHMIQIPGVGAPDERAAHAARVEDTMKCMRRVDAVVNATILANPNRRYPT